MENPFMFVIDYLSLSTKSVHKDFRSLSFLIDRALSFAVLLILITPLALLFHVFPWFSFLMPLITSVSLEFLLTWSSVFSSSSRIFYACSTNFSWRAIDSLVRSLMLFWFCLASVSAASAFLSTVSYPYSIHFFYYFFCYFLCIIFHLFSKETLYLPIFVSC